MKTCFVASTIPTEDAPFNRDLNQALASEKYQNLLIFLEKNAHARDYSEISGNRYYAYWLPFFNRRPLSRFSQIEHEVRILLHEDIIRNGVFRDDLEPVENNSTYVDRDGIGIDIT